MTKIYNPNIEAVDYYHALEHISDILSKLKKSKKKKADLFKELKKLKSPI